MRIIQLEENIHGGQVKDLVTKFFYRDNFLCFHILLQLEGGKTVFFREFTDYSEYKKIISELQQARKSHAFIHIPINNFKNTTGAAKVA